MTQYNQSRGIEYQPDESYRAPKPDQQPEGISPRPVSLPPQRKNWFLWIVLALFVVIAGIIFAGFQYKNIVRYQQPSAPEQPAMTTEKKELPGYTISFSFPENWLSAEFDEGRTFFISDKQLSGNIISGDININPQELTDVMSPYFFENTTVVKRTVIRVFLMDTPYEDAGLLVRKFAGEPYRMLLGLDPNNFYREDIIVNGRQVKTFDSRGQKPRTYDKYRYDEYGFPKDGFPEVKFYYFNIGNQYVSIIMRAAVLEEHEDVLNSILSTIKVSPYKREAQAYNKNGLYFTYPRNWTLNEEWSGRNRNLGEIDINPPYLASETYADKSIRFYVRPVGESQVSPDWKSSEFAIDGHTGKRYQYNSDRLGSYEPIVEEYIVIPLNEKYELAIWSENADIHRLLLDRISQEMKINLDELEKAVGNIKPYP